LDLVIYPKGTIPFLSPAAKVSIMLDLGYFYPALKAYKPADTLYMRLAMRYAAMNSKHIFAISEHTRQDVIRLLKVDPGRVHNIYGAASEQYRRVTGLSELEGIRKKYDLCEPFIFYPTNFSPRKNFSRLLDAFERIQGDIPHHLYFTGQVLWGSQDLAVQLKRLAARVHRLGLVPIEDMPGIYSLAQFAIYPSLFEGLGLPILEGFQCGTPMMVSDQSSIPEVAGDAALMVDAYDIEAIAEGLIKMAADADLRQRLITAGFEQARRFTWEKSVKALLDVLESDQ
jgi:glycosyltransferase involved in cell wall biosynthesis